MSITIIKEQQLSNKYIKQHNTFLGRTHGFATTVTYVFRFSYYMQ